MESRCQLSMVASHEPGSPNATAAQLHRNVAHSHVFIDVASSIPAKYSAPSGPNLSRRATRNESALVPNTHSHTSQRGTPGCLAGARRQETVMICGSFGWAPGGFCGPRLTSVQDSRLPACWIPPRREEAAALPRGSPLLTSWPQHIL